MVRYSSIILWINACNTVTVSYKVVKIFVFINKASTNGHLVSSLFEYHSY